MIIKETKTKIANVCNESGLSPAILDLIMQGIYSEIHSLAERQTVEEEMSYARMLEETSKKTEVVDVVADENVD
jgi:hypothetical protein